MINKNELRLGNFGNRIQSNGKRLIDRLDDFEDAYSFAGESDPIPLTPEILEKCGFWKRSQGVCDYFCIGENPVTHDWMFDLVWLKDYMSLDVKGFPFYRNGHHTIQHLHQLQNLYFALTGEELTINL